MKENRASFFARLRPVYAPSELNLVRFAYMAAKTVHRNQLRRETDESGQRVRYFEHLRRTALILIDEVGCRDPKVACMMILHDAVEDTDLELAFIEQFLGADVARGVMTLSKQEGESDGTYAARLLSINDWRPLLGKLCDTLDNLRTLGACAPDKQLAKAEEVEKLRYPYLEKLKKIAPAEYRDAIGDCCGQVCALVRRYQQGSESLPPPPTPPE